MKHFAVIGNPIAHSLSPWIHQQLAKQAGILLRYDKILAEEISFERQVMHFFEKGGVGLNVTSPFKNKAFAMAEKATKAAIAAKSANVLTFKHGIIEADNTDGQGLVHDLQRYRPLKGLNVLILGAGGAARGIIKPLLDAKVQEVFIWNRTEEKARELKKDFLQIEIMTEARCEHFFKFDLMIHATSAGFNQQALDLPSVFWESQPFCYDLTYSKTADTPFVTLAKMKGMQAVDGYGMLVEQAAIAFEAWHGVKVNCDMLFFAKPLSSIQGK